jgi:hypothetical protein
MPSIVTHIKTVNSQNFAVAIRVFGICLLSALLFGCAGAPHYSVQPILLEGQRLDTFEGYVSTWETKWNGSEIHIRPLSCDGSYVSFRLSVTTSKFGAAIIRPDKLKFTDGANKILRIYSKEDLGRDATECGDASGKDFGKENSEIESLKSTIVDPGDTYTSRVVVEMPTESHGTRTISLKVEWDGMDYDFFFNMSPIEMDHAG